MSRKLYWIDLLILFGASWALMVVGYVFSTGSILSVLPAFVGFVVVQLFGFPYYLIVGLRYWLGLNPYGLDSSAVWIAAVIVSYLVHLALLVGVVRVQDVAKRVVCIAAVVAFWCCSYCGFMAALNG